ncbi:MAG: hypothetical protein IJA70_01140 [Oscillospiraceae bacterium]|nr:hypothetical protein [Oscillospiraceae bacterium]MBQ4642762.1 hypothetical protein [Oscillospiraceae bacterium]
MMNKKIRFLPVLLAALLVLTMASGSVFAYMKSKTPVFENEIIPAAVTCEAVEETDAEKNIKTSIKVKNTGNIDAYLRVCLVTYWVDESGNIMPIPSETLNFEYSDNWVKGSNDIYYYKSAVAPGALTEELLEEAESIKLKTYIADAEKGTTYYQRIDVFAEAIQSLPAEAVTESWGVTLDGNGIITGVL